MVGTKTVKTSLRRIFFGSDAHLQNIKSYVKFVNCLETTVSHFVRWYYLKCVDDPLPPTESFYGVVLRAFSYGREQTKEKMVAASRNQRTKMIAGRVGPYVEEFRTKPFYVENVGNVRPKGLGNSISYVSTTFNTNATTNIKEHFMGKACAYITLRLEKKKRVRQINDDLRKGSITEKEARAARSKLTAIMTDEREAFDAFYDVVDDEGYTNAHLGETYLPTATEVAALRKELRDVLEGVLPRALPDTKKKKKKTKTTSTPTATKKKILVHFDVCCSPEDYVPAYLRLSKLYETMNAEYVSHVTESKDGDAPTKYPAFNFLPLKRSLIPNHVKIDTAILAQAILGDVPANKIPTDHMMLWSRVVNLQNKAFRSLRRSSPGGAYEFKGSILTDGVSVSVILQQQNATGGKAGKRKRDDDVDDKRQTAPKEQRITDAEFVERQKKKKVVAIDPNKRDLIFCMHEDSTKERPTTMRYTSSRRRRDTKARKNKDRRKRILGEDGELINSAIPTSTTVDVELFEAYLNAKKTQRDALSATYEDEAFRRMRLNERINAKRSEDRFMNEFEKKFGGKDDVVVVFGDWSDGGHTMKNQAPTKGKGMRDVFRRTKGYDVFLVDEFCTSKKCSSCGHDLDKCKDFERSSSRPWMRAQRKTEVPHGLLRCKNEKCQASSKGLTSSWKGRLWNRDVNATINMLACAKAAKIGQDRPSYLSRTFRRD